MKKNKLTKLALALGTVATIAAPIAAVVSCGGGLGGTIARYNTDERSTIELDTTFGSTGAQYRTLEAIVKQYNAQATKPADFKPVKLVHVEGGYGTIAGQLDVKFRSKTNEIPNMFIDYADAAGRIAWDGMELNLSAAEGQLDKKILRSVNDNIGGSEDSEDTTAVSKDLILPIAQSAEMMTVNAPLLNFLIEQAGGEFEKTGIAQKIKNAKGTDFSIDSHGWKKIPTTDSVDRTLNGYKVSDKDFESYEALFALASKLAKSQGLKGTDTKRILGLDSGPNTLYEMAYSSVKGIDKDFIYSKNQEKGYVNYDLFNNDAQKKTFTDTIGSIANVLNDSSTKIYGGGAYASSDTTYHQVAMSIGSTAGYSHNFVKSGGESPTIDGTTTFSGYVSSLATKDDRGGNYKTGDLVFVDGKYTNQITDNKDIIAHKHGTAIDAASHTAALAFANANTGKDKFLYYTKGDKLDPELASSKNLELKNDGKTIGFLIASEHKPISSDASTLQEDEMVAIPSPTSNKADGTKVAFLQGPGLIGVHNNTNDDKATVAFAKWFTSVGQINVKLPYAKEGATGDFNSPLDAWAAGSEYVVAADGTKIIGGVTDFDNADTYTKGNYFVTKLLKEYEATSSTFKLLSPAADDKSGVLRTELESIMKTAYNTVHGGTTVNAESMYKDLKVKAVTDGII